MSPVDGYFDSPEERVLGTIDTTNLPIGRHMIFIHAQDASGNWGAVGSHFLTVNASEVYLPLTMVTK